MFERFEQVYLFGSVLDSAAFPNDIDLLFVYKRYTQELGQELEQFTQEVKIIWGLPTDLTLLSVEEERETAFLKRIQRRCLKLK